MSGDEWIDEMIKKQQDGIIRPGDFVEWVPFKQLKDIKKFAKGGFGTIYKAVWQRLWSHISRCSLYYKTCFSGWCNYQNRRDIKRIKQFKFQCQWIDIRGTVFYDYIFYE